MNKRCLTKSLFNIGQECPSKIFYDGKPGYTNTKGTDEFLQALAEGGFQIGALARQYYTKGFEIEALNHKEAVSATKRLLENDYAVIYEAAFLFENFFVRTDIVVKEKNKLYLYEVKAKSYRNGDFRNKSGKITSDAKKLIREMIFQKYVLSKACPSLEVSAFLLLVDKDAVAVSDGLHQKFKLVEDALGRATVVARPLTEEELANPILVELNVDDFCEELSNERVDGFTPIDYAYFLAEHHIIDQKVVPSIGSKCGKCEFKASDDELGKGLQSGFRECWREALGWSVNELKEETILNLWDCRIKDKIISNGRIKMKDILMSDVNPKSDGKPGLSRSQRQWKQVEKVKRQDNSYWIDKEGLKAEMDSWIFPLHFIDFETSAPAIPFNKGLSPYENLAFQFSHHVVHEDGTVEHLDEFLHNDPGSFPNFKFVRELRKRLDKDEGTIFKYASHENSVLNAIYWQLQKTDGVDDKDELRQFIKSITHSTKSSPEKWRGSRDMVDMLRLVKRYYYDPKTRGVNSIKRILPSVLNNSKMLQEVYSKPIYGAKNGIKSLNYSDWTWVTFENGQVVDPYRLLPQMFEEYTDEDVERYFEGTRIAEGGSASIAYARMQLEDMSDAERQALTSALLKYCELDTLAMVMIYQGWKEMVNT